MNKYLLAIAGASLLSFSAFSNAADEIKHSDMEKYTKIGDVSCLTDRCIRQRWVSHKRSHRRR